MGTGKTYLFNIESERVSVSPYLSGYKLLWIDSADGGGPDQLKREIVSRAKLETILRKNGLDFPISLLTLF